MKIENSISWNDVFDLLIPREATLRELSEQKNNNPEIKNILRIVSATIEDLRRIQKQTELSASSLYDEYQDIKNGILPEVERVIELYS
ncbi:hypothetical protein GF376_01680 [Candidatus Peregrinibacteria bacterium]|nr:hypothetical protein [Candidatus Peregrinibacteria bacterium]